MKRALAAALLSLTLFPIFEASAATGCPKIEGLIDFNCDKKLKIAFLGDSIVYGTGDSKKPVQGYPGRIQKALPSAEIVNLGVPGLSSAGLLANVKQALTKKPNSELALGIHDADVILIAIGVNDFFSGNPDPAHTIRNITATVKALKTSLKDQDGTAPIIGVSTLIFTLRQFQQPFIRQLLNLMLQYNSAQNLPVLFRFDQVDVRENPTLGPDRLHPNGLGYDRMAKLVLKVLRGKIQSLMAAQRKDKDADGIYDELEFEFGTDSTLADTDGDGLLDGTEVFVTLTDPTKLDTDGDGNPDTQ